MTQLREVLRADQLNYTKLLDAKSGEGIVPVVCIDVGNMALEGLRAYRMQGFANSQAVEYTLANKQAAFYSRSQGGLWVKGMESGNILQVRAAYTDCDADSLLLDVNPLGPTCHTGTQSCFETITIGE